MSNTTGIKEVARRAGVSIGTVSNVLNRPELVASSTRQRVLDAITELGYVRNDSARQLRAGEVRQSIVEMDTLFLFTMSISDGSVLSVMADATCDVGLIGYEMALLVSRTESTLTPQLISEMRSRLPVAGEVRVGAGG